MTLVDSVATRVPRWLRATFRPMAVLFPELATRVFEHIWFTPPRAARPNREWAKGMQPLSLEVHNRSVRGWSVGSGASILAVHGWGGRSSQLAHISTALAEKGKRVVMFDMLGHGTSDPSRLGRGRSSLLEFAATIEEAGRQLGPLEGIVAHSAGCIATLLAIRAGLAVDRVVFISPMGRPTEYVSAMVSAMGGTDRVRDDFLSRTANRLGFDWADLDLARAPKHRPPGLVIHDRNDKEVPVRFASEIARRWDARLLVTEGLGHRRILRHPDVIEAVASFYGSPDGPRATPSV